MEIYLLRHGDYTDAPQDPTKGLNNQGKEEVETITKFLSSQNFQPEQIWHSDKKRAIQSAEIIAAPLNSVVLKERNDLGPLDSYQKIVQEIMGSNYNQLCIVGHLPFLDLIASALLVPASSSPQQVSFFKFQTASLALIELKSGQSQLKYFLSPSELAQTAS